MKFSDLNLNSSLLNALADMGLETPTPIQVQAFAPIMSGRDVVGTAQTGTGKTFAYLMPIIRKMKFSQQRDPRVVIIVPTRELVLQVVAEAEKLTQYITMRICGVYGGTNINTQKDIVEAGQDIIVATPGRLMDLCLHGALKLKSAKTLVIDEVDEMLNLGFRPQLINVIDLLPEKRQNLLFSATMTEDVQLIIEEFFNGPIHIAAARVSMPAEKIEQYLYPVPNFNTKINLLKHILRKDKSLEKILIFMRNKRHADLLFDALAPDFPDKFGVIHSNKSQNLRTRTVEKFSTGGYQGLIATDIIARGIDVEGVTHVINFELSEVPENYVHRIGRTARAEAEGIAFSFVTEKEKAYLAEIEDLIEAKIEERPLIEDIEISNVLIPAEKEKLGGDKDYLGNARSKAKETKGAFHDKKEKNKKKPQQPWYRKKNNQPKRKKKRK